MTEPTAGPEIDEATVARVAQLARLGLDQAELLRTARQLGGILEHFRALQAVDTTGVDPSEVSGEPGVPAPDVVAPFPQPRTTLLPLTAHAREGFYVVPAVLDTDFGTDSGHGAGHGAGALPPEDDPGADG